MGRLEQGGFIYPDGSFVPGINNSSSACSIRFDQPGPLPPGTFLVHTQPYARNDDLRNCGSASPYRNRATNIDADALIFFGLSIGLIIDADGIIVYSDSYDSRFNQDQAHFKDDEEGGGCGVNRN